MVSCLFGMVQIPAYVYILPIVFLVVVVLGIVALVVGVVSSVGRKLSNNASHRTNDEWDQGRSSAQTSGQSFTGTRW